MNLNVMHKALVKSTLWYSFVLTHGSLMHFCEFDQNWVLELILAWLSPHFHLVYWLRRDSNPQPLDHEFANH
jgi:hypothetical protein